MDGEDEVNQELEAVVEEAQDEAPERPVSRQEVAQREGGESDDPQDGAQM